MSHGRLTFSVHVALEFALGAAIVVLSLLLDFTDGAEVVGLVLGAAIASVAVSTSISGHRIHAHADWDRGMIVLLLSAAVISAISDFGPETVVFAAAALIEGVLVAVTGYRPEPEH